MTDNNSPFGDNIFRNLKSDLPAGLVVFLVALPLCLGIALASGAPLFSGLISGIIGGIVVGMISRSPLGVSGPAAGLAVIVFDAIGFLGFQSFLLAVVFAGLIQVILGFLRAGIIGYYFPSSVIKGMLAGIGIILILKQIPHAFGYDRDPEGDWGFLQADGHNTLSEIYYSVIYNSPGAVIISLVSIAILILWESSYIKKSIKKVFPGPLVVVFLGIAINLVYKYFFPSLALDNEIIEDINNFHLVDIPVANNFTEFIGLFSLPDFTQITNPDIYITALTIALIASIETLLCVEATDKLDPYKRVTPTNLELKAQGVGNIISGLIGGLPITQVIVRSSANINTGGKTKMSTIIHGVLLFVCVVSIPNILNLIPLSSLAAILLMVGYKLARVSLFKSMYKLGSMQFIPFIVTILGIVFTDLLKGISIGMAVAIFYILRNNFRTPYFYHKEENKSGSDIIKIVLSEEVSFLNKGSIMRLLEELPKDSKVIIDGSRSSHIDHDVIEIIENYLAHASLNNISVDIINIPQIERELA
ncbi:SulP family inorganic anion transporter [Chondrinema litorale]|uniref:SulP family inorganic anion transporter n=1 Tax=Chondrinema litorale TaxID=2994555 RepID=UPI002543EBD4|nr:SulP family inorganic anion transporter [Chondrinema litorale]UZR93747.1 SulP family inorganic anion transporter [Chondrinema litorale]